MPSLKKINETVIINNTEINYSIKISKHCKEKREYKHKKFQNRLLEGFGTEILNKFLIPHLELLFRKPGKYLLTINKSRFDNEKISLLFACEKSTTCINKYKITIVTALHRDTDLPLFLKISLDYRLYSKYYYKDITNKFTKLSLKSKNSLNITKKIDKKSLTKSKTFKIVKKVNQRKKYHGYKNISKLSLNSNTKKKLTLLF